MVPRGIRQVKDARFVGTGRSKVDSYKELMAMMAKQEASKAFVRSIVKTEDNLAVCLFTDDQLSLLEKYCSDRSNRCSPIHVDLTFKLTDMYALIFTMRATDCEGDPILLGPVLLTQRCRERDYSILCDQILQKRPQLAHTHLVFVTDGEEGIIKSLQKFQCATLFRCIEHLKDNVNDNGVKHGLSPGMLTIIKRDMVEKQIYFAESSFQRESSKLYDDWLSTAQYNYCDQQMQNFIKYYKERVEKVLMKNIISQIKQAGFLKPFDNNAAESLNAKLKNFLNYEKHQIHELVDELEKFVAMQADELCKKDGNLSHQYILRPSDATPSTDSPSASNIPSFTTCGLKIPNTAIVQMEREAAKIDVILNKDGTKAFARSPDGKEVIVSSNKHMLSCPCSMATRLVICPHIMATLAMKGLPTFNAYIDKIQRKEISYTNLLAKDSGKKPGSPKQKRKGGRAACDRNVDENAYRVVRTSNRIKVCNGCKGSLIGTAYVVRHTCRLPYPSPGGVLKTPTEPSAHHFHMSTVCIKRTHPQFEEKVVVEGTVNCSSVRDECTKAKFVIIRTF